jgi:hypothetical protein
MMRSTDAEFVGPPVHGCAAPRELAAKVIRDGFQTERLHLYGAADGSSLLSRMELAALMAPSERDSMYVRSDLVLASLEDNPEVAREFPPTVALKLRGQVWNEPDPTFAAIERAWVTHHLRGRSEDRRAIVAATADQCLASPRAIHVLGADD